MKYQTMGRVNEASYFGCDTTS